MLSYEVLVNSEDMTNALPRLARNIQTFPIYGSHLDLCRSRA